MGNGSFPHLKIQIKTTYLRTFRYSVYYKKDKQARIQFGHIWACCLSDIVLDRRAVRVAENPTRSTGQGSVSSMGNGSPRTSRAGTLCGEWLAWTCSCGRHNTFYRRVREYEAEHGIAEPTSAWQPPHTNGNSPQSRPSLRSGECEQ